MDTFKYTQLLSGKLKPLGYFSDELLILQSDKDFVCYIVRYIVPLIRKSPTFEKYYFQWLREKDAYIKERSDIPSKYCHRGRASVYKLKIKIG